MHKVVLKCESAEALTSLAEALKEKQIHHKLWIEQPENIPTCVALKPCLKSTAYDFLKDLKLFR